MLTKQEIKLKSVSSERILDIPDIVFEAIINEKKKYEKNKNRRIRQIHSMIIIIYVAQHMVNLEVKIFIENII